MPVTKNNSKRCLKTLKSSQSKRYLYFKVSWRSIKISVTLSFCTEHLIMDGKRPIFISSVTTKVPLSQSLKTTFKESLVALQKWNGTNRTLTNQIKKPSYSLWTIVKSTRLKNQTKQYSAWQTLVLSSEERNNRLFLHSKISQICLVRHNVQLSDKDPKMKIWCNLESNQYLPTKITIFTFRTILTKPTTIPLLQIWSTKLLAGFKKWQAIKISLAQRLKFIKFCSIDINDLHFKE